MSDSNTSLPPTGNVFRAIKGEPPPRKPPEGSRLSDRPPPMQLLTSDDAFDVSELEPLRMVKGRPPTSPDPQPRRGRRTGRRMPAL